MPSQAPENLPKPRAAAGPTPQVELPPGFIEAILGALLPKIIEALIAALLDKIKPPTPVPPPIIDIPPMPVPQPPAPGPPPRPYEAWLQAGLHVIYHNWFRGNAEEGVPEGNSTAEETEKVRQGILGLPPGARVHISADPMPTGCVEFPFPAVEITFKDEETGDVKEYVLTKENPQPDDGPFWIQGGQTATSVYIRSNGHFFILICPEPAHRSSLVIRMRASNGAVSNPFGAPWFIRGNGTQMRTAAKSPQAMPMSAEFYDAPDGPQERTLFIPRSPFAPEPKDAGPQSVDVPQSVE